MESVVRAKDFVGKLQTRITTRKTSSYGGEDDFESMEDIAWKNHIIAPNGPRKARWDWFILFLVLYTSFAVPFQLSFYPFSDPNLHPEGFAFDVLVDIFFIIDVFVSWRTTYYNKEGILIVDKKMAYMKYLKTWFPIDVFASFPFEYVAMFGELNGNYTSQAWSLPSMIKVLRIARLGKKIDRLSSNKMFRIFQFTFVLVMFAHWYACLWYGIGSSTGNRNGEIDPLPGPDGTSWVYRLDMQDEDIGMRYVAALYWSVTTLMKSPWFHPNSPLEFVVAIFMIILGCVLFAYFLGNVTAVITAANAKSGRYRGEIERLTTFCSTQNVSLKMASKLLIYQDALWTETSGGTEVNAMLNTMPNHLLPYVLIGHIYRPLMDACPFLFDCSAWGCVEFLRSLKVQVCERGDTLIRAGTLIASCYILVRGEIKIHYFEEVEKETAEIYVQGGRIGSKHKGRESIKQASVKDQMRGRTDKFGTLIAFNDPFKPNTPREYTVDALSRCSLLMITRAQLKSMMTQFEDDKPHILKAIEVANEQHRVAGTKKSGRASLRTSKPIVPNPESLLTPKSDPNRDSSPPPARADEPSPTSPLPVLPRQAPPAPASPSPVNSGPPAQSFSAQAPAHMPHQHSAQMPDKVLTQQPSQMSGLLAGFLTPNTQLNAVASEVESLRGEVKSLRDQIAKQNDFMAKQSQMMEQLLTTNPMTA
uniref:Cyclic nucleotide-binding domain-containing protein n=1 Tax=Haptolina brevifila TaxID=156173 RepID=A0A7S2N488_9EUKA|mmetsp:Transcript_65888/g.130627  ORF Transcript_65888/g.130627 Transcript_65888/m.130627 type:complete len:702 (+) Transcript_65888:46-2151(+)